MGAVMTMRMDVTTFIVGSSFVISRVLVAEYFILSV
jgi:hypothetical protein